MRLTVGLLGVFAAFIAIAQPWASPSLSATPTVATVVEACHSWDIWGSTAFESARYLNYEVGQSCGENHPVSDLKGWGFYQANMRQWTCGNAGPGYTLKCQTSHRVECPEGTDELYWVGSAQASGASPPSFDDSGYLSCSDSEPEW